MAQKILAVLGFAFLAGAAYWIIDPQDGDYSPPAAEARAPQFATESAAEAQSAFLEALPERQEALLRGHEWHLQAVRGEAVPAGGAPATLRIDEDGRVSGHSGCNRFGGQAEISESSISFGALFSTRMACVEEARNKLEADYTAALSDVVSWRASGGLLMMQDAQGAEILIFAAAP